MIPCTTANSNHERTVEYGEKLHLRRVAIEVCRNAPEDFVEIKLDSADLVDRKAVAMSDEKGYNMAGKSSAGSSSASWRSLGEITGV